MKKIKKFNGNKRRFYNEYVKKNGYSWSSFEKMFPPDKIKAENPKPVEAWGLIIDGELSSWAAPSKDEALNHFFPRPQRRCIKVVITVKEEKK